MRGKRTSIVSVLLAGAGLLQAADYFPLASGNAWVYKLTQGSVSATQTIEVGGTEKLNGRDYFHVDFLGRPALLRLDADGTLLACDRAAGSERPWISFGAAEGEAFPTFLDSCDKSGRVESRSFRYGGPAGTFDDAIQIFFQLSCADAGITSQVWAPGIGLVQHSTTSIAGERRYELQYATVGATRVAGAEQGLLLAIDQPLYSIAPGAAPLLLARLTLRNSLPGAEFSVGGGQEYDLLIRNEKGAAVYQWSQGKAFPLVLSQLISGIVERNYAISVPLAAFLPGRYTAEAVLPRAEGKQYAASVPFEIRVSR